MNPALSGKARLLCAATVFVAALGLYLWTLAPTVTLVDSGELIVAARTLGVAHPPGFPLYVMMAHAATLVPMGNVAVRVHFVSALAAALAAALLTLLVLEALSATPDLSPRQSGKKSVQKKKAKGREAKGPEPGGEPKSSWSILAPALVSGLLLACSRTLWAYATMVEVYALNALLIIVIFFLMLRWRRRMIQSRPRQPAPRRGPDSPTAAMGTIQHPDRWLYAAALVFGLALGVHHVTVGLMLPALAALVYFTEGRPFFKSRRLVTAAVVSVAGLVAVYAYLPVAASRSPVMNWGDPRTLERIWWHVTGRQYQVFLEFSPEVMVRQLGALCTLAAREFGPWWLPLGLVLIVLGFVTVYRRDRTVFYFLALVVVADVAYALNYEIAEDKDAYYLPAFIAAAIAAGFGARRALALMKSKPWAAAALLLVPVVAFAANLPYNNRSRYFIAEDYVDNILTTIGPRGMLLTLDWQVQSPMLYLREVEDRRTDVVTIDVNLLRRSWYFDYLKTEYPDLYSRTRDQVEAFLKDLRHWEQAPKVFERDAALTQQIDKHFYDMILAFVRAHIPSAPVYVTQDIGVPGPDSKLTQLLTETYGLVPQGLVFQLTTDREFHEPAQPGLVLRGLTDGTIRFEEDDVVKQKVFPVYLNMLVNRGRYLALHGHHDRAIESYNQALALDPNFALAHQSLSDSLNALRAAPPPD